MIAWAQIEVGNHRLRCPECSRGERDKTLSLTMEADGHGVAYCHRCQFSDYWFQDGRTRQRLGMAPLAMRSIEPTQHITLSDEGRAAWGATKPLAGAALSYLKNRACVIPPEGTHLRWWPQLRHPRGDYTGPALAALVTDIHTREPISIHRTWILASGAKPDVLPKRMLWANHRKVGGVIRLWPDDYVGGDLAIAEGIETALSVAHAVQPVWSCIDAGNLRDFPVLAGVARLWIGADHDKAGIEAGTDCANRWAKEGREVRLTFPAQPNRDWNDVAMDP